MQLEAMLNSHPNKPTQHLNAIVACIQTCYECAQLCTLCADACIAEPHVEKLRRCIRLNLDCAAICEATGQVAAEQTETVVEIVRKQLESCALACDFCADECERHAAMHQHCQLCAHACRRCKIACNDLLAVL